MWLFPVMYGISEVCIWLILDSIYRFVVPHSLKAFFLRNYIRSIFGKGVIEHLGLLFFFKSSDIKFECLPFQITDITSLLVERTSITYLPSLQKRLISSWMTCIWKFEKLSTLLSPIEQNFLQKVFPDSVRRIIMEHCYINFL